MKSFEFVKKIRNYAIASFIIPLIAINSCLLIFKYLGDINITLYPDADWDIEKTYTYDEFILTVNDTQSYSFTNCPKYNRFFIWTTIDNKEIIEDTSIASNPDYKLLAKLKTNNKIKSVTSKKGKKLNNTCIKNHHSSYSLIKRFEWVETIVVRAIQKNPVNFPKIKNPYLYGEVSISRTARYFPQIWIFKSLIILTSFLLFLYWKNNLNFFDELKNRKTLFKFSKKFFYLGAFSCIFLALHAIFLGLNIDSILFAKARRLIIILFIFFELCAQIFLTKNLFELRKKIKKYINPLILKVKIIFVTIVLIVTCIAFAILSFGDPSSEFKHALEWNYFGFLLFYYAFSRLLWKV